MGTDSVSVVIPAFNAAGYVARAVESCLAQTYRPKEIIVVDDGSSDGTSEIVAQFPPPVRLIRQTNAGPAAARNHGAQVSTGDWVGLLDADDYWFPDKLRVQLEYADRPEIGVIYSLFDTYAGRPDPLEVGFSDLWDYNWIGNSSALIRRSAFEAVGGFHEARALMSVEDYNLWIRLAAAKWRLILCPHILVHYERNVGISSNFERLMRASLYNIDHLQSAIAIDAAVADAKRLEIREDFARRALGAREMAQARKCFQELFRLKPTLRTGLFLAASYLPPALLDARRRVTGRWTGPGKPHTPPGG
jgi:glycosyltransferase involved in cell wall biosynthesis